MKRVYYILLHSGNLIDVLNLGGNVIQIFFEKNKL